MKTTGRMSVTKIYPDKRPVLEETDNCPDCGGRSWRESGHDYNAKRGERTLLFCAICYCHAVTPWH